MVPTQIETETHKAFRVGNKVFLAELDEVTTEGAVFDESRQFRYMLWRDFDAYHNGAGMGIDPRPALAEGVRATTPRSILFIGLNPSTADEKTNDPTVRRMIRWAKTWGYDRLYVANLYPQRATNPKDLKLPQPVDKFQRNEDYILAMANTSEKVILAWGNNADDNDSTYVVNMLRALTKTPLFCFGKNKLGQPKHVLYLPYSKSLEVY